jgi:RimJ/RimL family protein N-acetyltransferase
VPSIRAIIETPRLVLRHFVETDLDALAAMMANADFTRFSSGVFAREQSASFLFDRVIASSHRRARVCRVSLP